MLFLRRSYTQWVLLAAAVSLWVGVGYFAWVISNEFDARAAREAGAQESAARRTANIRLQALAADTKDARAKLEGIASTDAITIANTIDQVSRDSGTHIAINQAQSPQSRSGSSPLHSVDFTLEADGTFPALFQVASLLAQLPIPSTIDSIQFARTTDGKTGSNSHWHATMHVRFLTTVNLSS